MKEVKNKIEKLAIIYKNIYVGHGKHKLVAVVGKKEMDGIEFTVEDMENYQVVTLKKIERRNNREYITYIQERLTDKLLVKLGNQEMKRIQKEKNAKKKGRPRLKSVINKSRNEKNYTKVNTSPFLKSGESKNFLITAP